VFEKQFRELFILYELSNVSSDTKNTLSNVRLVSFIGFMHNIVPIQRALESVREHQADKKKRATSLLHRHFDLWSLHRITAPLTSKIPFVASSFPKIEHMAPPKRDSQKEDDEEIEDVVDEVVAAASAKKKRLCREPGCTKVIKSQGHCQRHGAKAKRCKVEGCYKQAQGTHDGMCKRHWKVRYCDLCDDKRGIRN
jgi:hypothetical protein